MTAIPVSSGTGLSDACPSDSGRTRSASLHIAAMDERALLARLIRGPMSEDDLAGANGQAVRTRTQSLRDAGVPVTGQPGQGYRLAQPVELLDNEAIIAALPPPVRTGIASLDVDWVLDSTNSELLRRPVAVDGVATVLLAEQQTGGRGRRGRDWSSPLAANLYLSLSRTFRGGLARLGGLSLATGIATVEALHALGYVMVQLKWPNDLVVTGPDGSLRKLGGLLVESGGGQAGAVRAVIGLGLNVRMPEGFAARLDQPWCDLSQLLPAPPSRNALAAAILVRWVPLLDEFDRNGLTPLLPRYAALDAIAGQPVSVRGETVDMSGVALGLAGDGSLRVRMDDGAERRFHAGEVSLRRAVA